MFKINFFLTAIVLACIVSCKSITLDSGVKTSDLLHSNKEFGKDLHSLKYENKFILQIGDIDTTDEAAPIKAAIIIVNKKEIVMNLVSSKVTDHVTNEVYSGNGFKIYLFYKTKIDEQLHENNYSGSLIVENKNHKSEYSIAGLDGRL